MTSPTERVPHTRHVAVVGAGIAGLAAAWHLRRAAGEGLRVTVLDAAGTLGGKLRVSEVAGVPVDEGAEAMLARRPEALDLATAVGLGDALVTPATTAAAVWTRGRLRPLPAGQVMGVPGDLRAVAASGVLSLPGLARVPLDAVLPAPAYDGDVEVGRYVAARLGREVVERLVEPLLGGVYAGRADELSFDATVPALAAAARQGGSLLAAARRVRADTAGDTRPVFAGIAGGVGRLPEAVAAASGADVRLRTVVRELRRTPHGWALVLGPTRTPELLEADAVVLALPAHPAARLLAPDVPAAAADLAAIDYASVALVTLAFRRADLPPGALPAGSGFLVPPVEGRSVKGVTFASAKWGWLADSAPEITVVRCSVGRYGEQHDLQRHDADLAALARRDLAAMTGIAAPPVATRVTRWGGGLPQYAVGHRARVERIRAAVAAQPGLAVCGAAYDGLGIPACIATARDAATQVLRALGADRRQWGHDRRSDAQAQGT